MSHAVNPTYWASTHGFFIRWKLGRLQPPTIFWAAPTSCTLRVDRFHSRVCMVISTCLGPVRWKSERLSSFVTRIGKTVFRNCQLKELALIDRDWQALSQRQPTKTNEAMQYHWLPVANWCHFAKLHEGMGTEWNRLKHTVVCYIRVTWVVPVWQKWLHIPLIWSQQKIRW